MTHLEPIPLNVGFEFGGYTIPFQRTSIKFTLSGREPFLAAALDAQLGKWDEVGRKLFTSHVLRDESLQFGLRVTNHLIEAYRIAYDDPGERPIGVADVLSAAMVIELTDGLRQTQYSGISIGQDVRDLQYRRHGKNDDSAASMEALLSKPSPPFSAVAISELKKAQLYGQYRECVVWAGTIIANVIEDVVAAAAEGLAGVQAIANEKQRGSRRYEARELLQTRYGPDAARMARGLREEG